MSATSRRSPTPATCQGRAADRGGDRSRCRWACIEPPGAQGADIVVGEGQSIGNGLQFRRALCRPVRQPREIRAPDAGTAVGETVDAEGQRGFVLTLSTREQHIRREKATSNICTNSGLCALAFTIHLSLLGEEGLTRLARAQSRQGRALADAAGGGAGRRAGQRQPSSTNSRCKLPKPAAPVVDALAGQGRARRRAGSRLLSATIGGRRTC